MSKRDQTGTKNPFYSHGMTKTSIYLTWQNMKRRCMDKSYPRYADWGGRGITVCDRWLTFSNFYADMGDKPVGMTLERIDNDKGYYLENCKWATATEQIKNQRLRKDNTSGVRGINKHSKGGWMLRIEGKYYGTYKTVVAARTAREMILDV